MSYLSRRHNVREQARVLALSRRQQIVNVSTVGALAKAPTSRPPWFPATDPRASATPGLKQTLRARR